MEESKKLAAIGVSKAKDGKVEEALELFNSAIELNDEDFRYYVNRGYCLIILEEHQKALMDLNKGLSLQPTSYKCRFLKGRALCGLKLYLEAEKEFNKLLPNKDCVHETKIQLMNTRYLAVKEKGYSDQIAFAAAAKSNSIDEAVKKAEESNGSKKPSRLRHQNSLTDSDVTLSSDEQTSSIGKPSDAVEEAADEEVYWSEEEQEYGKEFADTNLTNEDADGAQRSPPFKSRTLSKKLSLATACKMLREVQECDYLPIPSNLLGFKALFVANISPTVDHNELACIFTKYGTVLKIVIIKTTVEEPAKVIVNYDNIESPVKAIGDYYQRLFTDVRLNPKSSPLSFKFTLSEQQKTEGFISAQDAYDITKLNGECFFWRAMSGCGKRRSCTLRHIRVNRGIDTHPWKIPFPLKTVSDEK